MRQEYTEVCFVPEDSHAERDGPEFRSLAISRGFRAAPALSEMDQPDYLPFPTMNFGSVSTGVGIVARWCWTSLAMI